MSPAPQPVRPSQRPSTADACNYCQGSIMWLSSRNGARMPVDAEPSPDGNVIVQGQFAGVLGKTQAAAARASSVQLHLHHVVSCPHADQWNAQARAASRRKAGTRR